MVHLTKTKSKPAKQNTGQSLLTKRSPHAKIETNPGKKLRPNIRHKAVMYPPVQLFHERALDMRWWGYNHLISNKREGDNCFTKNTHEILLDFAVFTLQEQLEDILMVTISRAWYNGCNTMVAKSIKSLELHYTMIQILINSYRPLLLQELKILVRFLQPFHFKALHDDLT